MRLSNMTKRSLELVQLKINFRMNFFLKIGSNFHQQFFALQKMPVFLHQKGVQFPVHCSFFIFVGAPRVAPVDIIIC